MQTKHLIAMVVVAFALGSAFLFIRVLINAGMDPLGVAAARVGVTLVLLTPVMYWQRDKFPRDRRVLLLLALVGLINMAIPYSLVPLSQQHISSGTAAIVSSSMPMITAVLAASFIAAERITRTMVAGLVMGFLGVLVLMGGDIGAESTTDTIVGMLLVLAAVLGYAIASILIRQWHADLPVVPLTYVQVFVASCVLVPFALATGAYSETSMGLEEWGSIAGLTVSGTALAMLLFMWLIIQVGPVKTSVVTYLFPPIGVTLGWLLLDETVGWSLLLALVLIVVGVALVQRGEAIQRFLPSFLRTREAIPATGD